MRFLLADYRFWPTYPSDRRRRGGPQQATFLRERRALHGGRASIRSAWVYVFVGIGSHDFGLSASSRQPEKWTAWDARTGRMSLHQHMAPLKRGVGIPPSSGHAPPDELWLELYFDKKGELYVIDYHDDGWKKQSRHDRPDPLTKGRHMKAGLVHLPPVGPVGSPHEGKGFRYYAFCSEIRLGPKALKSALENPDALTYVIDWSAFYDGDRKSAKGVSGDQVRNRVLDVYLVEPYRHARTLREKLLRPVLETYLGDMNDFDYRQILGTDLKSFERKHLGSLDDVCVLASYIDNLVSTPEVGDDISPLLDLDLIDRVLGQFMYRLQVRANTVELAAEYLANWLTAPAHRLIDKTVCDELDPPVDTYEKFDHFLHDVHDKESSLKHWLATLQVLMGSGTGNSYVAGKIIPDNADPATRIAIKYSKELLHPTTQDAVVLARLSRDAWDLLFLRLLADDASREDKLLALAKLLDNLGYPDVSVLLRDHPTPHEYLNKHWSKTGSHIRKAGKEGVKYFSYRFEVAGKEVSLDKDALNAEMKSIENSLHETSVKLRKEYDATLARLNDDMVAMERTIKSQLESLQEAIRSKDTLVERALAQSDMFGSRAEELRKEAEQLDAHVKKLREDRKAFLLAEEEAKRAQEKLLFRRKKRVKRKGGRWVDQMVPSAEHSRQKQFWASARSRRLRIEDEIATQQRSLNQLVDEAARAERDYEVAKKHLDAALADRKDARSRAAAVEEAFEKARGELGLRKEKAKAAAAEQLDVSMREAKETTSSRLAEKAEEQLGLERKIKELQDKSSRWDKFRKGGGLALAVVGAAVDVYFFAKTVGERHARTSEVGWAAADMGNAFASSIKDALELYGLEAAGQERVLLQGLRKPLGLKPFAAGAPAEATLGTRALHICGVVSGAYYVGKYGMAAWDSFDKGDDDAAFGAVVASVGGVLTILAACKIGIVLASTWIGAIGAILIVAGAILYEYFKDTEWEHFAKWCFFSNGDLRNLRPNGDSDDWYGEVVGEREEKDPGLFRTTKDLWGVRAQRLSMERLFARFEVLGGGAYVERIEVGGASRHREDRAWVTLLVELPRVPHGSRLDIGIKADLMVGSASVLDLPTIGTGKYGFDKGPVRTPYGLMGLFVTPGGSGYVLLDLDDLRFGAFEGRWYKESATVIFAEVVLTLPDGAKLPVSHKLAFFAGKEITKIADDPVTFRALWSGEPGFAVVKRFEDVYDRLPEDRRP